MLPLFLHICQVLPLVILCILVPTLHTIVVAPSILQHTVVVYIQTIYRHDPLLPTKPNNKSSSITSQNPTEKIKTKHTDAQSSFLTTLSIKITIKIDHVWEKTHIPKTPTYTWRQTQTHETLTNYTKIIIIIIIIINQQQIQTNP
jgi:hypothetical protein